MDEVDESTESHAEDKTRCLTRARLYRCAKGWTDRPKRRTEKEGKEFSRSLLSQVSPMIDRQNTILEDAVHPWARNGWVNLGRHSSPPWTMNECSGHWNWHWTMVQFKRSSTRRPSIIMISFEWSITISNTTVSTIGRNSITQRRSCEQTMALKLRRFRWTMPHRTQSSTNLFYLPSSQIHWQDYFRFSFVLKSMVDWHRCKTIGDVWSFQ